MKKVKIILTALIVMATVGGALAFKATKMNSFIFCSTSSSSGANCVLQPNKTYIANSNGNSFCTSDGSPTRQCTTQSDIADLN